MAEPAPVGAQVEPAADTGRPPGETGSAPARRRTRVARWPLLLLALPAFVAIWGGWVELRISTAVTLPIGLETYAAYALHVALSGRAPTR